MCILTSLLFSVSNTHTHTPTYLQTLHNEEPTSQLTPLNQGNVNAPRLAEEDLVVGHVVLVEPGQGERANVRHHRGHVVLVGAHAPRRGNHNNVPLGFHLVGVFMCVYILEREKDQE